MQRFSMILNAVLLVIFLWVWNASAGTPAGPDTEPASTEWYKIEDIYNRLSTGTAGSKSPFTEPSGAPDTGTMHTLNDVMAKAHAKDDTDGAKTTEVVSDKSFWGLTSGKWGQQTGTAQKGDNVTGEDGKLSMTIPDGFYSGSKSATVKDSDLTASNIKKGVEIFGVTGSVLEAKGNATAADVLKDKTFSNDTSIGVRGTMTDNGAVTITPNACQQKIPAGYHNGEGKVKGDSNLVASNIEKGVEIFGVTGTLPKEGEVKAWVPKTGQTTKYSTGDDGDLKKGVKWPEPRFTDNCDGTVTDNLTGLIWLKNANCTETLGGVSFKEGKLDWNEGLTFANKLADGNCGLSDGSKAGDWRLPNRFELSSLLNLEYNKPALSNTAGTGEFAGGDPFGNVQPYFYWSSTTHSGYPTYGWIVYLGSGNVGSYNKAVYNFYVWPVRGGQ